MRCLANRIVSLNTMFLTVFHKLWIGVLCTIISPQILDLTARLVLYFCFPQSELVNGFILLLNKVHPYFSREIVKKGKKILSLWKLPHWSPNIGMHIIKNVLCQGWIRPRKRLGWPLSSLSYPHRMLTFLLTPSSEGPPMHADLLSFFLLDLLLTSLGISNLICVA